ncbi:glutamine-rich protein 2 [Plectropomus leopardus]|uniref:glutamine-rich protein 2 n=1 Tax=Plectropomus leopardus TaxID=160734 RepID=UPI001C4C9612|nr:glutamine-rich protein 2 [Plectropomus leopardus]
MSEVNISLLDLLNLSIGTPEKGAVNFSALHTLLHALLRHLGIREVKTRWRDTPPGDALEDKHQRDISAAQQEAQPGTEKQERTTTVSSPTPSSGHTADSQWRLQSRIQTCEDSVSKAMKLLQELQSQRENMKEEMKDLHHQQKMVDAGQTETVSDVEKCCHRVDALEDTVRSLREKFPKYPVADELSQCVTWDIMQSALLGNRENLQKDCVNSGVDDQATYTPFNSNFTAEKTATSHTSTPSSPHPVEDTGQPAAPMISAQISTDTGTATGAPSVLSGPLQQTRAKTDSTAANTPLTQKASSVERYSDTVEALRDIGKLRERFSKLEARVAALEEGKLDNLEDMFMSVMSQDRETTSEASSGSEESHSKVSNELRQQMSYLRKCVQRLEEDMKQLKAKQALFVERITDQHLQDQLDDLRGKLEDMMQSLTSQLYQAGQDESDDSQSLRHSREGSAFTISTVNIGRELSLLFQHYEQLQDTVNKLLQQQAGDRAGTLQDVENVELVNDVQKAILQLQAECEKLHETARCLDEDNRLKQSHIEELYKTTEELEEKKADKQMVESEIKADKSALESKVSRLQFDSATEHLNAMFHELLNKVTGQEQDWHKVIDKLSTEMECKLNRIELDSVKKQLEDRWKNIHEKLQAQGAPEHEDAAGIRKQLVDRFHCLSCDRPVVMHTPAHERHLVKLPSTPGFPSHKSIRPFTVYALEQFRQHYRSERISEMTDYSHLAVSRSCGGSHTVTSASQRRTGLQSMKHHTQTEVDGVIQTEEVDIIGLDGHIYKGRLNAPATKNTETKLPTISTKDGMCKTKDKAKCSLSHKPAASPEVSHHPNSAKSTQCSRSASSSSGRDWPVSALGCTSQSSVTPASAAAESNTEPHADEPLNL